MRSGQEAARRFHEEPERSSDFLCLPDLEDFLFCLRKKKRKKKEKKEENIASSPANVRFAWIGFQPFGAESRASFRPAVTSNIRSLGGGLEILFVTRRRGGSLLRGAT